MLCDWECLDHVRFNNTFVVGLLSLQMHSSLQNFFIVLQEQSHNKILNELALTDFFRRAPIKIYLQKRNLYCEIRDK